MLLSAIVDNFLNIWNGDDGKSFMLVNVIPKTIQAKVMQEFVCAALF